MKNNEYFNATLLACFLTTDQCPLHWLLVPLVEGAKGQNNAKKTKKSENEQIQYNSYKAYPYIRERERSCRSYYSKEAVTNRMKNDI